MVIIDLTGLRLTSSSSCFHGIANMHSVQSHCKDFESQIQIGWEIGYSSSFFFFKTTHKVSKSQSSLVDTRNFEDHIKPYYFRQVDEKHCNIAPHMCKVRFGMYDCMCDNS